MKRRIVEAVDGAGHGVQLARQEALARAQHDCAEPNWDGYGAAGADRRSARWARRVLGDLPTSLGVPEVAFEPDGDAGFEWWWAPDTVLAVSVGKDGEVRYAARVAGRSVSGAGMFADGLPSDLLAVARELLQVVP